MSRRSRATELADAGDPGPQASRAALLMPALVLGLGLVSLTLLLATRWIDQRLIQRDETLVHAVDGIRIGLAASHLWLEELVTGDSVPLDQIAGNLEQARRSIDSMLGRPGGGDGDVPEIRRPQLRRRAEAISGMLDRFTEITERRQRGHAAGEDVGIGSEMDVAYDAVFAELFEATARLSATLEDRLASNRRRAGTLFRAIIVSWILIVGLAVAGMVTLGRRRTAAERALWDSRRRLLQAQKMEAVGGLAGGIAHDINNYLAAIRGHAELADQALPPADPQRRRLETIARIVDNASRLIDRLLAFARRQPTAPRVLAPNQVLSEGVAPVLERLIGSHLRLEVQLEENVWPVEIDPAQLEQVVVNLVVNARDASAGGGRIRLSTANVTVADDDPRARAVPRPGDYVALSVADEGTGIAPEVRERIFEPFFTTKDRTGSSGLGLATVFGVVESAGGGIVLDSRPGEGSTFTVLLPRVEGRSPETVSATSGAGAGRGREREGGGLSILLVEDNHDVRASVTDMLETVGHRVIPAEHPVAALAALDARAGSGERVDLLITDLVMPGMDGRRLAREVLGRQPDVRVLFVSGWDAAAAGAGAGAPARDGGGLQGREGAAPLLRKPFSMDALLDAVEQAMVGASGTGPHGTLGLHRPS